MLVSFTRSIYFKRKQKIGGNLTVKDTSKDGDVI